jgi:hypothetical protein
MKISVKVELKPVKRYLKNLEKSVIDRATPRALNRAMTTVAKEAGVEARKVINLPLNGSSKGGGGLTRPGIKNLLRSDKATSTKHTVSLWAIDKAISLIHFITGEKAPDDQRGKAVWKRRKLVAKVTPSTRVRLPHSFIAKANGAVQVFARKGKDSLPLHKRAVKGLFQFLNKKEIRDRLEAIGRRRFLETLAQDVKYWTERNAGKLK